MSRISPTDKVDDMIARLADQHPLALIALQAAHTQGSHIDPELGNDAGVIAMRTLDELGIYGDKIANLFSACRNDPTHFLALCRAVQLQQVPREQLVAMSQSGRRPRNIDLTGVVTSVQSAVPSFGIVRGAGGMTYPSDAEGGVF